MEQDNTEKTYASSKINWFPGHMMKAMRMMEANAKLCDGVMFVLDARAPFACLNEALEKKLAGRPFLYVLNKCDLISTFDRDRIIDAFKASGKHIVPSVAVASDGARQVYTAFKSLLTDKIERNRAKGIKKTLRAMVAGIPNTGKSAVINSLCGRKAAMTGNKAGVTRGKQWVKLDGFELLDTPGTMPPALGNDVYGRHLAYIGSLNDSLFDFNELALDFLKELLSIDKKALALKYGEDILNGTPLEIYEEIGRKRGCLLKGGVVDYDRCGKMIIDDFRKGRAGKICLESPAKKPESVL